MVLKPNKFIHKVIIIITFIGNYCMAPSCDLKSSLTIAGLIPQEAEVYAGTLNLHIIQELPEPQQPKQELPVSQIPADKLKAMQDYARKLKRNSPGMKMERLQRKVAEKFKVKIV